MPLIRRLTILIALAFLLQGCASAPPSDGSAAPQTGGLNAHAFFCPRDGCEERMVLAIGSAKHSVDAAVYSFTSPQIAGALLRAQNNGAKVRLVADLGQSEAQNSQTEWLSSKGIETRVFPKGATMHNKFAVIDSSLVITGSFNWTKSAAYYNRENLLMLFDSALAQDYEREFFRLWIEAG